MNFSFNLSVADVELISEALSAMPYNRVHGLLNRLQGQVNQQIAASQQKPEPPKTGE